MVDRRAGVQSVPLEVRANFEQAIEEDFPCLFFRRKEKQQQQLES